MKELKQMGLMLLGVIGGFVLGAVVLVHVCNYWPSITRSPTLSLLVAVPILGGGLVGGGYLVQVIIDKYERWQKRKKRAERQKDRFGGKGS